MNRGLATGAVLALAAAIFFVKALQPPVIEVLARPDGKKPGYLGIAVYVTKGSHRMYSAKGGEPLRAKLEVRTADGELVHETEEDLKKFTFG